MGICVLTSAAGSPGVTTLAIGLALTWPRAVLLADCDPCAGQAVLAGFLRGQSRTSKGLLRVAEAHRDRRALREVVMDQTIPLTAEPDHTRLLLPGFVKAGSAQIFSPVWPDLAETFSGLGDAEIDVIVDAGRITAAGLPLPLLERADLVCLVTRTSLRAVAATRVHAATLSEQLRLVGVDGSQGLVLVGEGKPYRRREISDLLGVDVLTALADDPLPAACLSDGTPRPRRFDSSAFAKSLHQATSTLSGMLMRSADRLVTDRARSQTHVAERVWAEERREAG